MARVEETDNGKMRRKQRYIERFPAAGEIVIRSAEVQAEVQ